MASDPARPIEQPDEAHAVEIATPCELVWAIVSDITRTPQWSPVVTRARWVDPHDGAAIGARFRGDNRFNGFRWSRECEVTACDPPRVFGFSTFGKDGREQTRWRYTLEPLGDGDGGGDAGAEAGTRLTLAYQVVRLPRWVAWSRRVPGAARTSARQATENMTVSLRRIAALAASSVAT